MIRPTDDLRIRDVRPLIPPAILLEEIPISERASNVVSDARAAITAVIEGRDPAPGRRRRPVLDSRHRRGARIREAAEADRRSARRQPDRRDAHLLRKAAHGRRLEGADQRSRSRRELPHQQGAAAGAAAAARRQRSRPADRIGVPRHPDPAAHRRPDVVGGDRRAHGGEPGAPRAGVGAVDAGRLQEQHRRQHADRGRRGADRALAALVSVGHQAGRVGDLPDRRQRRVPRHPARRHAHRPELRRRARRQGRRAGSRRRGCARA